MVCTSRDWSNSESAKHTTNEIVAKCVVEWKDIERSAQRADPKTIAPLVVGTRDVNDVLVVGLFFKTSSSAKNAIECCGVDRTVALL